MVWLPDIRSLPIEKNIFCLSFLRIRYEILTSTNCKSDPLDLSLVFEYFLKPWRRLYQHIVGNQWICDRPETALQILRTRMCENRTVTFKVTLPKDKYDFTFHSWMISSHERRVEILRQERILFVTMRDPMGETSLRSFQCVHRWTWVSSSGICTAYALITDSARQHYWAASAEK